MSWEEHMKEIGREDLLRFASKCKRQTEKIKKTSKRFTLKESSIGKIVSRTANKQKVKAKELEE